MDPCLRCDSMPRQVGLRDARRLGGARGQAVKWALFPLARGSRALRVGVVSEGGPGNSGGGGGLTEEAVCDRQVYEVC